MKPIMSEAKVAAIEILDSIFSKALDMHILEPKIVLKEHPEVKLTF